MDTIRKIFSPSVREWVYKVSLAILPILVAAGIITEDKVPLIVGLISAVLVIGLAEANVEKAPDAQLDNSAEKEFVEKLSEPIIVNPFERLK